MPSFVSKAVLSVAMMCLSLTAFADADAERAMLARLIYELEAVESLLNEAESQSEDHARHQFQYGWLKQDLQEIKLGIQAHIDGPRREPRTFKALRGDYRR